MEPTNTINNPTPLPAAHVPNPNNQRGGFGGGNSGGFNPNTGRKRRSGGPGGDRRGRGGPNDARSEYDQKVIDLARVTRVTKGGKRFSFRATIIIGDAKGKVGMGIGKGKDVAQSVQKAFNKAKKNLITVATVKGSIPYQVEAKYNSAIVLLKPARGGVKAGGPVRVVAKMAGITALTGKLLGRTNNKINIAMATLEALKKLKLKK